MRPRPPAKTLTKRISEMIERHPTVAELAERCDLPIEAIEAAANYLGVRVEDGRISDIPEDGEILSPANHVTGIARLWEVFRRAIDPRNAD